ncbi:MAG: RidA family protein [Acidobacteria bacterium]|nr:RidA family protein [Acidobacteriota bacterium]
MRKLTFIFLAAVLVCAAANPKVLFPKQAKPIGPYSPGIQVGDRVYLAGQGSNDPNTGKHPESFPAQVRQTIENIRAILQSGGMDLRNLAYCQVYLDDFQNYETARQVLGEQLKEDPPAAAFLGVAAMPGGTHVEISCIATTNASSKKAVRPDGSGRQPFAPGMLVGDALYISGQGPDDPATGHRPAEFGAQVRQALENIGGVLKAAGLGYPNMIFVNPYLVGQEGTDVFNKEYATFFEFGNTPGRATIFVTKLPKEARINFTGVALRDLSRRRAIRPSNMAPSPTASPCVFGGDTLYCSAKSGFVPSDGIQVPDLEGQLKQTMRNLLDGLEEAGLGWADIVSTNVYLDDIADFAKMNAGYRTYFSDAPPARATVQQVVSLGERRTAGGPGKYPTLEQISLIAVRRR